MDVALDLVPLRLRHNRAHVAIGGRTDFQFVRRRLGDADHLGHACLRHQHARRRVARLAGIAHAGLHAGRDRLLEIRVIEQNVRRLAAELLANALDRRRGSDRNLDASARRTRERNAVDAGVRGHGSADVWAIAVDEIEHALGHAGLVQDFGNHQRRVGRELARLQHHRAAGRECARDLARDLVRRPIPRRDHADDADRLA